MMQFITEWLLKEKIELMKDADDKMAGFMLTQCEKELEVLKRLNIEGIDLRGSVDEVAERLKGNSIYFMNKSEFDEMQRKAVQYDIIRKIMEGSADDSK